MVTLTKQDRNTITDKLSAALYLFSNERLSLDHSERIAEKVIANIDISDSTLQHKGVNWLAKDILKKLNY